MKQQRDLNGAGNLGLAEAAQITALIIELHRIDRGIGADIVREEQEAGLFDVSNAAYPIMARILKARRNNLANTIASLEAKLTRSGGAGPGLSV
jgi:hypothetical protein